MVLRRLKPATSNFDISNIRLKHLSMFPSVKFELFIFPQVSTLIIKMIRVATPENIKKKISIEKKNTMMKGVKVTKLMIFRQSGKQSFKYTSVYSFSILKVMQGEMQTNSGLTIEKMLMASHMLWRELMNQPSTYRSVIKSKVDTSSIKMLKSCSMKLSLAFRWVIELLAWNSTTDSLRVLFLYCKTYSFASLRYLARFGCSPGCESVTAQSLPSTILYCYVFSC